MAAPAPVASTTTIRTAAPIGRVGRYEVLGRLAQGGMAEILLARERSGAGYRHLVLKRILPHVSHEPEMREMFLAEARLAMRLSHTAICAIHELGDDGERLFFAMEWVRGMSLAALLDRLASRGERLAIPLVARIFASVAEALHYAHGATDDDGTPLAIVHRDVSPENVMIGFDGQVKLLDFGIAKAALQQRKTRANVLKGKFAYMSPEQYAGETIDARADVFALGVCMWEALTGERLFERASEYETVAAIVLEDATRSPRARREDVPEAIDLIVQRCLKKEPKDRPASAGEVQRVLETWLAEHGDAVPAARIAEVLQRAFAEELRRGPQLETRGVIVSELTTRSAGTPSADVTERMAVAADAEDLADDFARSRRRKTMLVVGLTLVLVLGLSAALVRALLTQ